MLKPIKRRACPSAGHYQIPGYSGKMIPLLFLFMFAALFATAQTVVTGRVTNENGEGLAGASVKVKGSATGTNTNNQGNFSIQVPNLNATLEISFIGFVAVEEAIGGRSNILVSLKGDGSTLSDVVVVGYGRQSRRDVTTAITKLDAKALENIPYANAASALQGTLSGVRVQSVSGQPGAAPRIIVRGGTSINNPNGAAPLYIIDGVIRPDMNNIAAEDIQDIQVLKDAGSTAIYGARGTNGVVLVTTKSGRSGKAVVNYNYGLTMSQVGKTYDMANARDYLYYSRLGVLVAARKTPSAMDMLTQPTSFGTGNDLSKNTNFTTQYLTPDNQHKLNEGWQSMPDPVDPSKTLIYKETNWQDVLFRRALSHNHHLSVSGGNEKATFNAGVGYMKAEGVAITTKYDRITLNLNGDIRIKDNLKVFGRTQYSNSRNNEVYNITQVFFRSAGMSPVTKYTFEDGTLAPGFQRSIGNPAYQLQKDFNKNNTENLTLAVGGQWDIIPGLTFSPQVSIYKVAFDRYSFLPSYLNGATSLNTTRAASSAYNKNTQYQADGVFSYLKKLSSGHNFDATAGVSYWGRQDFRLSAAGQGAATDLIPTLNASATPVSVSGYDSKLAILGYFARLNYNYKQKYLLSVTSRYDGASNLGKNHKWGFFPGVSAGWNLHNEEFMENLLGRSVQLKLRGSYGVTGNISGLADFQSQGEYAVGNRYMGASAIENTVIANSNLKWEQSKSLDLGFDLGLFNRRVDIIASYYNRVTDDLLTSLALPPSTGFSSVFTNLGSLRNRGVDMEISALIFPSTSELQWRVSANASLTRMKIMKLPYNGTPKNRVGGVYTWDNKTSSYQWLGGLQEGGTIGDFFSWQQVGIYATDKDALEAPLDMTMSFPDKTKYGGDANYADLDRNDTIDTRDLVYQGNPFPKWTGGFSSSLSYKGFNLYVRADYTLGHTIYNYAKAFLYGRWAGELNIPQDMLANSWKEQGDIAEYVQYVPGVQNYSYWRGSAYHLTSTNSKFYESGDFLCIREVTLSYNLPASLLKKFKISNLRFNLTGSNLHYFTKYSGTNPEDGGLDQGRYPMPKNITFGANISL